MGWQHKDIISVLEAKRKARDAVYHQEKIRVAVCLAVICYSSLIIVNFCLPVFVPLVLNGRFLQKLKTQAAKQVPAEIQQTLAKLGY